jgi:dihydroorotate dehydrogenase (NAD+) catalytic subunit
VVYACYRATGLPIVGMGGVRTGRDVLDFVAAGAQHVALGTILFGDPHAPTRIRDELVVELERRGLRDLEEVLAAAHTTSSPMLTT